eukprot:Skav208417  [mRNA]  locus=scaffold2953:196119:204080:+ [translate_table: standard]
MSNGALSGPASPKATPLDSVHADEGSRLCFHIPAPQRVCPQIVVPGKIAQPSAEDLESLDESGQLRGYYAALKAALEGRPAKLEAQLVPLQEAMAAAEAELQEVLGKLSELEARKQKRAKEAAAAGAKAAEEATEATAEILVESSSPPAEGGEAMLDEALGQLDRCRTSIQQLEKSEAPAP